MEWHHRAPDSGTRVTSTHALAIPRRAGYGLLDAKVVCRPATIAIRACSAFAGPNAPSAVLQRVPVCQEREATFLLSQLRLVSAETDLAGSQVVP